jgi:hypothetical protein
MTPAARIAFGVIAFAILSGLVWLCVKEDAAAAKLVAAAPPVSEPAQAPLAQSNAQTPSPAPASRKTDLPAPIPIGKLTQVAKDENRIIYTTNALGEPLEIHPDGSQVIHGHRQVLKFADGREEVRFTTIRMAPPTLVSADQIKTAMEVDGATPLSKPNPK